MRSRLASEVSVRIHPPCVVLQPYVTFFYFVEAAGPVADFLYPEWGNVRFVITGEWKIDMPGVPALAPQDASLFGPTDRPGLISTEGGLVVGFGLTPLGWHALIRHDASRMANRSEALGDALGEHFENVCAKLWEDANDVTSTHRLEQLLLDRLSSLPSLDPTVLRIDAILRERPSEVAAFAERANMSVRTLHRICLKTFGFPPKRLLRLQRFLDTLGRVRSAVGASVCNGLGIDYFDESHFYRDFRDFMRMTPRSYFSSPRPIMAAAAMAQAQAGITLSFALPPGV